MKCYIWDKESLNFIKKTWLKKGIQLFHILAYKCVMNLYLYCKKTTYLCKCPIQINCTCEKTNKITVIKPRFIYLKETTE